MSKHHTLNKQQQGRNAWLKGVFAEWVACALIWLKGYQILHRRFKCQQGEIDIVATRGKALAIIEVKYRKTHDLGLSCLSEKQKSRLIAATRFLLARKSDYASLQPRFDLIIVSAKMWPHHILNAWDEKQ